MFSRIYLSTSITMVTYPWLKPNGSWLQPHIHHHGNCRVLCYHIATGLLHWPLGNTVLILKCNLRTHVMCYLLEHFLWQLSQVNATEHHWWWVKIGNDWVPSGNKPQFETIWFKSTSSYDITSLQWVKLEIDLLNTLHIFIYAYIHNYMTIVSADKSYMCLFHTSY